MLMCIMLAYLLLFTALFNAACLHNACLFLLAYFALDICIVIIYTNAFFFFLCLSVIDTGFLLQLIFRIKHSAFI